MTTPETTIEKLQDTARLMNAEKLDLSPYQNLGVLIRVRSEEYRIRKKQQVIVIGEIEHEGEQFAYFMT